MVQQWLNLPLAMLLYFVLAWGNLPRGIRQSYNLVIYNWYQHNRVHKSALRQPFITIFKYSLVTPSGRSSRTLHWRYNDHDGVSNHQPHGCLLNRLFRRRSKKTSQLRVTGLCVENSPGPVYFPHKGPVTRKMFPFDDVIMKYDKFAPWVQTPI